MSGPVAAAAELIAERGLVAGRLRAAVILPLALAWALPAEAEDAVVRVMTQNVYQGTNFDEVVAATRRSLELRRGGSDDLSNNIMATEPAEKSGGGRKRNRSGGSGTSRACRQSPLGSTATTDETGLRLDLVVVASRSEP